MPNMLRDLFFGKIDKIDIHCANASQAKGISDGVMLSLGALGQSIPVSIKPNTTNIEYVMINYSSPLDTLMIKMINKRVCLSFMLK